MFGKRRRVEGERLSFALVLLGTGLALAGCTDDRARLAGSESVMTIVASGGTTPTVAVHPITRAGYVSWIQRDADSLYNVYLTSTAPGATGFSAPVRVNDVDGDAAAHEQAPPQVAIGPGGEVYVVWQNNTIVEGRRFPASDLRLAVSTDGGASFAPAVTVNDDVGGMPSSHTFHNIAVAPDGSLVVSWIDSRVQDRLDSESADSSMPAETVGQEIRIARSTNSGASFSPSVVIDSPSCPCCRTSIALGADGSTYVAWRKLFPNDIRDIVVARAEPGSLEFAEPVRVHADDWEFPGCPHAGPALAVDTQGRLHVAWYTGKEGRQGLWHAVSANEGSTFSAPTPLVTGEFVPPSQVALTALSGSEIAAAWEDRTDEAGSVMLGRIRGGVANSPSATQTVSSGRLPALNAAAGRSLMVWLEGETIRGRWLEPDPPELF